MQAMPSLLVGTSEGLMSLTERGSERELAAQPVTGLSGAGGDWWALAGERRLLRGDGHTWHEVQTVDGPAATCVGVTSAGTLVGTAEGHLWRFDGDRLRIVDGFENAASRDDWYTPWGGPADVRSLCESDDGIFVNVHVGGILRSSDGGTSWRPTIDIHADVHQVIAGGRRGQLLAATARGLGVSDDAGATWRFHTAGLPATYLRAVAVSGGSILVTASSGPGGSRSGVHRTSLDADRPFQQCDGGLPADFGKNIDTHCLAASGERVAIGAPQGTVHWSPDGGGTWDVLARDVGSITCLAFAEDG
jgi:hypothetical protein